MGSVGEVGGEIVAEGIGRFDSGVWAESEQDGHGVEMVNELQFHEARPLAWLRWSATALLKAGRVVRLLFFDRFLSILDI